MQYWDTTDLQHSIKSTFQIHIYRALTQLGRLPNISLFRSKKMQVASRIIVGLLLAIKLSQAEA